MENSQFLIEYAPIIIVLLTFIWKNKLFVTPQQLAEMKLEILTTVKNDYATKEMVQFIRDDLAQIKDEFKELNIFLRTNINTFEKE